MGFERFSYEKQPAAISIRTWFSRSTPSVQTAIMGILNSLALLTIALLLRAGLIAVRRFAGQTALAVPVRAQASHPYYCARVRPTACDVDGLLLRAPPILPAQRRRVNPGISGPN